MRRRFRLPSLASGLIALEVLAGSAGGAVAADAAPSFADRIDRTVESIRLGPEVPLATDFEFVRRVYLDLAGRTPTIEETQSFLARAGSAEGSAAARRELIDDLLERDEFSRYYAKVLDVMFTERRELIGLLELRALIHRWLDERRPLNELCTELLAGDGTGKERAAASFFVNRNADPHLVTRDIGRIFFGRDVQCAQCHDHPLVADYEQSEYFGILSFVNRTYLFKDEKRGGFMYLGEKGEGSLEFASVFLPEKGKSVAEPVLPMAMAMDAEPDFVDSTDAYVVAPDKDRRAVPRYSRRQQLAVLATHPENESFNRNLANRLWAQMMGVGVVSPVDMHHSDNPAVSAALLRLLADELVASGYDLREFLRQIARSATYQRSVQPPDLQDWEGPAGGQAALAESTARLDEQLESLQPRIKALNGEMSEAAERLRKSQADVARLQKNGEDAKAELQRHVELRDKETAALAALRAKQAQHQEMVAALQTAVAEAEKVLQIAPDDQELAASRALFSARLAAANEAAPGLESQVAEQQEVVDEATFRVDDQRGRILALANRRLALGEFVVEARGVQRRLQKQMQALIDQQLDCRQQQARIALLEKWLVQRDATRQAADAGAADAGAADAGATDAGAADELVRQQKQLDLLQGELLESWRRSFAIRRVRGLSPEQLTGATYTALEMYQPVRGKALADWEANNEADPAARDDARKRQAFVTAAVASNMWDTVEDLIVARFSLPAGSPQDGFFATVDQALTIQNEPTYQNWIKPAAGNLIERLLAMDNAEQFVEQLYLSVVCRLPDDQERRMVGELLDRHAAERAAIVPELVWGLLASAEFRFVL